MKNSTHNRTPQEIEGYYDPTLRMLPHRPPEPKKTAAERILERCGFRSRVAVLKALEKISASRGK